MWIPSSSIKILNIYIFWEKMYNMGINDFLGQVLYYFNQIVLQNFWNLFFSSINLLKNLAKFLIS